jgi:hypothetical protein
MAERQPLQVRAGLLLRLFSLLLGPFAAGKILNFLRTWAEFNIFFGGRFVASSDARNAHPTVRFRSRAEGTL